MKLRLTAAFAIALLTASAAHSASDADNAPVNAPVPPKHDKAAPAPAAKTDKTPAAAKDKTPAAAKAPINQFKTAAGFWQQADDDGFVGAWFYFTEHKGVFEGRIVKAFKKADAPEFSPLCQHCEGDQKDAPMIGLTIIKGMKRDGRNYDEGSIMDPRDGTVYHAQMELSPDGKKLSVRGYLGIPLLGQTQVWTRLSDDTMAPEDIPPESFGPSAAKDKDAAKAQ
jgi:uncharacterized protein (DUF2147 family)